MFEELSPEKERAIRAYIIFSVLFFVVAIGTGFVMAADRGYGAFPWNSDTTVSCNTPGGPYYSSQRPRSEQHCPSDITANVVAKGDR